MFIARYIPPVLKTGISDWGPAGSAGNRGTQQRYKPHGATYLIYKISNGFLPSQELHGKRNFK